MRRGRRAKAAGCPLIMTTIERYNVKALEAALIDTKEKII